MLFLALRTSVAERVIRAKLSEIRESKGIAVAFEKLSFRGFDQLELLNLTAGTSDSARLIKLEKLDVNINLWRLIRGALTIDALTLKNGIADAGAWRQLRNQKADTSEKSDTLSGSENRDLPSLIARLKTILPQRIQMENLKLQYADSHGLYTAEIMLLSLHGKQVDGSMRLSDDSCSQTWKISGEAGNKLHLRFTPVDTGALPLIYQALSADVRLRAADVSITILNEGLGGLPMSVSGSIEGLRIKHSSLSTDTIVFNELSANAQIHLNRIALTVDSVSDFKINHIKGSFGLEFPLSKRASKYALKVRIPLMPANDFFASLPQGAFDDTRNLKASGELRYRLDFALDGHKPDDVEFYSSLERVNFRILEYPSTPLTLMNSSFTYQAYMGSVPVRRFVVGTENPNFIPLDNIPQRLINSILTTEDPSFFRHGGFIQDAFKESIATNYKAGGFKRGGSTISMQLVKNVFLNRKKTVFRKMEEALIVWLIETQRLTSKERMMEVYLNVIEWGPNVYGIGEASRFYFAKSPAKLSLPECLFLANIIPRPTAFRYCFDKEGNLRDFMVEKSRFIVNRMVTREFISPADTLGFDPYVKLSGPAKAMVVPEEVPADSIRFDLEED